MSFCSLDLQRTVHAGTGRVRDAVLAVLRHAGFHMDADQLTYLQGHRGSRLAAAALQFDKLPHEVTASLQPGPDGCVVSVRMEDRFPSVGLAKRVNGPYRRLFGELQEAVDEALGGLDAAAMATFPPPVWQSTEGDVTDVDRESTGERIGHSAGERVGGWFSGRRSDVPEEWRDVNVLLLVSGRGVAHLTVDEMRGWLTVALLVATAQGAMPPNLEHDVEAFAARIEQLLTASPGGSVEVSISDAEVPVAGFLDEQAEIRERLPVRTLETCVTCRTERVVSPDLQRLQKRNKRLRGLGAGMGFMVNSQSVSPFVMVGSALKFAHLDPDWVCTRCQGTECQERMITFCPQCGDMRREAVLRRCPKCSHDFRSAERREALWTAMPPPPPPPPIGEAPMLQWSRPAAPALSATSPLPPPADTVAAPVVPAAAPYGQFSPAPAPTQLCRVCGGAFLVLWRVVVDAGGGRNEEWLVCGRPPRCTPPSLVAPVRA